jgi:hypothetical protein
MLSLIYPYYRDIREWEKLAHTNFLFLRHPIVHVKMFTFYRWLSMRGNLFLVCSACGEIGSAYAQHAVKSFPRMLSIRMLQFSKMTQKYLIKMQISPIKNQNFEKPSRNLSDRTKVKILRK